MTLLIFPSIKRYEASRHAGVVGDLDDPEMIEIAGADRVCIAELQR
jgi:hypothetical protein